MAQKLVVGPDGPVYVETTPEDDAQAATDAQASANALAASQAEATRLSTVKANARQAFLMNALTTLDATGILNGVAARYPGLTGDGLKAVQDEALVLAVLAKR